MLDTETKHRIDAARDILVGKVPDPKSQVEQITIALIYKFMDDMDAQSEELGGKRTFFAGEFEKFGWAKLLSPGMGGYDVLNNYGEALTRMPENPGIPLLFRDIFKNAYLPYRDPETLKSFLKIIDDFNYDHSERLGDAFEYLLSVLSSQGAAGQFRTPRHIIDFMVSVIEPEKDDSILDPACGTAGFLISAYKHIMAANARDGRPGAKLSPDERTRLLDNIQGYDISPDMVRLSLVNLYLHGFADPHIYEYDTLTSTDKWNDIADIILANPPFMSPTGGIRPHNRFSVQSKRSEVLFVDYIAEHLTPSGRAAVIVPEGIIFQSQNAYKNLRKMLLNGYLVGVISLPAGVFNPYSGVKTSILWMDKVLARKTEDILFVKIENDGFDLGAQRREVADSDLPEALQGILKYKASLLTGQSFDADVYPNLTLVPKADIAENGEYNLGGERYKEKIALVTDYTLVDMAKVVDITTGKKDVNQGNPSGIYPFFTCARENTFSDTYSFDTEAILVAGNGDVGSVKYFDGKFEVYQRTYVLHNFRKISARFLYFLINTKLKETVTGQKLGNTMPYIKLGMLKYFQIPLPPLPIQEEIVAEIEGYQRIIDGARQVVDAYRPRIDIDPKWLVVKLGDVCEINRESVNPLEYLGDCEITYIDISSIENETGKVSYENIIKTSDAPSRARRIVRNGDVIISTVRPNLKAFAFLEKLPEKVIVSTGFAVLSAKSALSAKYLYYMMRSDYAVSQMISRMGRGAYPSINQKDVSEIDIPLAPLITQKLIVDRIETEWQLVEANRKLIDIFEEKIKNRIAKVWGE